MQQHSLLQTKLYIPPIRPEVVSRPRLIDHLNAGLPARDAFSRSLTLVSAPAGFGKTTLVSEWVHKMRAYGDAPPRVAWLSLDEGDNDPARFLAYLIAALQTIDANIGKGVLSALQSPQPAPAEAVLTSLINELAAYPDTPQAKRSRIILVLDDHHTIESTPVDDALAFLLERVPPQMHLVIATREDPRLPLARLRARGQLTEVRASDLRFTPSEAAEFLNQAMGLNISAEDIAALERRTEGWIAGLQLAALALQGTLSTQGQEDATSLIRSFTGSHRYVLDYLVEEVLERQPESVQTFLLQTAILDRLTGSLCDTLTGCEDSQQTLEMLERTNLFIVPLDTERRWYRYHHLFADLLRQRLRQTHPEKLPILHRRASDWFRHQGYHREAIKYSLAAGDYEGAAGLIRTIAIDIIQQGEHTTVAGWIKALPDELVKEQSYLCVLYAWALQLVGQLEAGKSRLIDAENALELQKCGDDQDVDIVAGLIHSLRAYQSFMTGELDKTISYAGQALDQLPESADLIRVRTAQYLGVAHQFLGQLQAALDAYNQTLPLAQRIGGNLAAVMHFAGMANTTTVLYKMAHLMDNGGNTKPPEGR